jgi:hypothetical protein
MKACSLSFGVVFRGPQMLGFALIAACGSEVLLERSWYCLSPVYLRSL